jgi:hypothetical protein
VTIADVQVIVGNVETGELVMSVYFARVPCKGESVRLVDRDLVGVVVAVCWEYAESEPPVLRQTVTVWIKPTPAPSAR